MILFAFSFFAPAMLWGLGLASIPIVIHLLNRQRYRESPWAAMEWLLAAIRKNSRRVRFEQWLLLAIRTLIVILVVLAMSKPMLETASALLVASSPATHHVFMLDNSMSMQYAPGGGQSRLERAKGMAQSILDDARKGDFASVIVLGTPPTALVGEASPYLTEVAKEIEAIRPQDGTATLDGVLPLAKEILGKSRASRKRIYFLSDMQRTTWMADAEEAAGASIRQRLSELDETAELVVLAIGEREAPNWAVVDLDLASPVAVMGQTAMVRARVANYSAMDRQNLAVEMVIDDEVEGVERIDLPAGEERTVLFSHTFRDAGDHAVQIRLPDDSLDTDNRRHLTVRVRQTLGVLLIDGDPSGERFRSETDFLRIALAPNDPTGPPSLFRVETRPESELLETRLDDWDVVILANVGQLSPGEAGLLEEYLRRGGGVLFFLGSQTNLEAYNRVLFGEGEGILPVRLTAKMGEGAASEAFFRLDPLDYQHPLIEPFRHAERAGLLSVKIFRYIRAERPPGSILQVPLAYHTGDPAILLGEYGQGRVGMVTTSADPEPVARGLPDWNNWAYSPSFLPVVRLLIEQMVAGRVKSEGAKVGELVSLAIPSQGVDISVRITPPEGETETVRVQRRDNVDFLEYAKSDRAGIYRARLGPPLDEDRMLAVNTWPAESQLDAIDQDEWASAYPGVSVRWLERWEEESARTAASTREPGAIHQFLLYAALALVFLETLLAWRFGHHR